MASKCVKKTQQKNKSMWHTILCLTKTSTQLSDNVKLYYKLKLLRDDTDKYVEDADKLGHS